MCVRKVTSKKGIDIQEDNYWNEGSFRKTSEDKKHLDRREGNENQRIKDIFPRPLKGVKGRTSAFNYLE